MFERRLSHLFIRGAEGHASALCGKTFRVRDGASARPLCGECAEALIRRYNVLLDAHAETTDQLAGIASRLDRMVRRARRARGGDL